MPAELLEGVARESGRLAAAVHWQEGPELLDAGDAALKQAALELPPVLSTPGESTAP